MHATVCSLYNDALGEKSAESRTGTKRRQLTEHPEFSDNGPMMEFECKKCHKKRHFNETIGGVLVTHQHNEGGKRCGTFYPRKGVNHVRQQDVWKNPRPVTVT